MKLVLPGEEAVMTPWWSPFGRVPEIAAGEL
jgi:hypothetical protein